MVRKFYHKDSQRFTKSNNGSLLALQSIERAFHFLITRNIMLTYIQFITKTFPVKRLFPVAFIASLLLIVGCGERLPPDLPRLYPTAVIIVQEDKALEGATVVLHPKDPDSRWGATGLTDASGRVDFFTEGRYRGVPEGEYQLTVSKVFTEPSQYLGQERPAGMDDHTWDSLIAGERLNSYNLVDTTYGSRRTSPLELSVGPGQPRDRQFDVGPAINEYIRTERSR